MKSEIDKEIELIIDSSRKSMQYISIILVIIGICCFIGYFFTILGNFIVSIIFVFISAICLGYLITYNKYIKQLYSIKDKLKSNKKQQ